MANTQIGLPRAPEPADESAKAKLNALILQYENDPDALERILKAGQEATGQVNEGGAGVGPDFLQENADARKLFMERYGINELLSSADPDKLEGGVSFGFAPSLNKVPIEITQADFDALFGSDNPAIRKYNVHHTAFVVASASALLKAPDGKLYQVSLVDSNDGGYEPFEYTETSLERIEKEERMLKSLGEGVDDTRSQVSGLS